MPMDRAKYPADWEAISRRIRFERAGGKCEAIRADGSRCDAPHGQWIARRIADAESWTLADAAHTSQCECSETWKPAVRIVLTVAHLDHDTTNNADDNLAAWCQLHHLRYDAKLHAKNGAETRRRKAGALDLFTD